MTFKNSSLAELDQSAEVPYIKFPLLSDIPFLMHGFSTRLGGISKGIFSSLNLGSDSSPFIDDPDNIRQNFERIAKSIGVDPQSIVLSKQVHKTTIRLVDEKDRGKGLYRPRDYEEVDGLITNQPNITLVTKYADCVPLFFVDPVKKAIGLSHSGWRGTVSKIGQITVKEMEKHFGSNPKDILAVIGPSICKDCYEVGEEVAMRFMEAFPLPADLPSGQNLPKDIPVIEKNASGRYQCNLWEANRRVLLQAGLNLEHIHISGVCTSCHSELLFSHRKTQGKRGSLAAFLAIRE